MTSRAIPAGRFEHWLRQRAFGPAFRLLAPATCAAAWLWRRLMVRTTFIAVTGGVGKTTAKELLAGILATHRPTFRTHLNQNGPTLVAMNLLRVRPWHRYAVIEVGVVAPNTMHRAARLVHPDAAVILNVAKTHSTGFASLDEHAAEKAELLRWVRPAGFAVLDVDDPRVRAIADACTLRVVRVGTGDDCDYRASDASSRWPERLGFTLHHDRTTLPVATQLVGVHWQGPVLAAIAAAHAVGVPLQQAVDAALRTPPFPGRMQPVRVPAGAIVLRDDYNGSVDTLEAAVRVLEDAAGVRRMLVITDMSDTDMHRRQRLKVLAGLAVRAADALVLVGENAGYGRRRAIDAGLPADQVHAFDTLRQAAGFLRRELGPGDLMLLRGRTTDHAARVFFAQIGDVGCWKETCSKRLLCDHCWELDVSPAQLRLAVPVPPPPRMARAAG